MNELIENYITKQNEIIAKAMENSYEGAFEANKVFVFNVGRSYVKVCRNGSVHSFIAVKDINTKAIQCKQGDILKPASWNAPANHARGSVFEPDSYADYQWTGPHYLK